MVWLKKKKKLSVFLKEKKKKSTKNVSQATSKQDKIKTETQKVSLYCQFCQFSILVKITYDDGIKFVQKLTTKEKHDR